MNYIYDITLNFNKNNLYEFYEWKDEDEVEFILKIPVFKVSYEDFISIKNNDIIVSKNFLNLILDKTEVYAPNSIKIIKYSCIFACEKSVVVLEFDSDGKSYMKSNISVDEEEEILDYVSDIKYSIIDYKVTNKKNKKLNFCTREERETQKYLLNKLEKMLKNNEDSKLKYIFYEIYNEKTDDVDRIYSKLINITKNKDSKFIKLKNLICLIENKKIVSNNS